MIMLWLLLFCFLIFIPRSTLGFEENDLTSQNLKQQGETTTRTLVLFSGPTTPFDLEQFSKGKISEKEMLYHDNFRFFLRTGLLEEMEGVDFIFILTKEAMDSYSNVISYLSKRSKTQFKFLTRKRVECYDMGSYRTALQTTDISGYEKFIFLNCGLRGPFMPSPYRAARVSWPSLFTSYLNDQVKLVGLSVNCRGPLPGSEQLHLQSMLWATDKKGLSLILREACIYDCVLIPGKRDDLIIRYELCLSRTIIENGYFVQAVNSLQSPLTQKWKIDSPYSLENCTDFWYDKSLPGERNFHPLETIFFKVSRFLTEEVQFFTQTHLNMNPFPPGAIGDEMKLMEEIIHQTRGLSQKRNSPTTEITQPQKPKREEKKKKQKESKGQLKGQFALEPKHSKKGKALERFSEKDPSRKKSSATTNVETTNLGETKVLFEEKDDSFFSSLLSSSSRVTSKPKESITQLRKNSHSSRGCLSHFCQTHPRLG